MIGEICKHKKTNHIGKIIFELNGTSEFPEQWGIKWYDGTQGPEHAKRNREIGVLYFFNDKELIEIFK